MTSFINPQWKPGDQNPTPRGYAAGKFADLSPEKLYTVDPQIRLTAADGSADMLTAARRRLAEAAG